MIVLQTYGVITLLLFVVGLNVASARNDFHDLYDSYDFLNALQLSLWWPLLLLIFILGIPGRLFRKHKNNKIKQGASI